MPDQRAVLVTGAAGLVGSEVVRRLRDSGRRVVAVTHRTTTVTDSAGNRIPTAAFAAGSGAGVADDAAVTHVSGDVRRGGLGLPDSILADLATEVGMIVHCAATTDFAAREELYEELNVRGTQHVCDLATTWDVPLVYVSTAYVCGRREGTIAEQDLSGESGFSNGYEQSKYRAERLIRDTEGLAWAIVRPGIVTGYSDTGAIRDHKNLYTIVRMIVEGKLRTLPGRYNATLSLAPLDFVADVVTTAAVEFDSARGRTFHAVGDRALSLRAMSDVFAEYPSFEVARFVPPAAFHPDELDTLEREYFDRIGAQYVGYFDRARAFDTTGVSDVLGLRVPATGADYLRVLLDRCLEVGFLGSPLPSLKEIIACSN